MAALEEVLADVARQIATKGLAGDGATFERRVAEAARADLRGVMAEVLGKAGRVTAFGPPTQYRVKTVVTLFGHVSFPCAYYAVDYARMPRQMRRKLERDKARGRKRLEKNTNLPRKGGATSAYPALEALGVRDTFTPSFADVFQRLGVVTGSFAEGAAMLKLTLGVELSTSTFRRRMLLAGARAVEAQESPRRREIKPRFSARVLAATTPTVPTMYIMADGMGVPCVKKDTKDSKGKGADGIAGTREVKVGVVGTYRRLDRKGRPFRDPGGESHIVSMKSASEFGILLRRLADSLGYGSGRLRIQIIGDGAEWIAAIVRNAFPGALVIFTNDFYHACEYLYSFVVAAEPGSDNITSAYRKVRAIFKRYGAATLIRHLKRKYAHLDSEHQAWKEIAYIEKRVDFMKYNEYLRDGLYIGSGPVEAACRTDVARRCKQAGMHWRFANAAAICALTARFRSNLPAV